jgi:hypothetical protein
MKSKVETSWIRKRNMRQNLSILKLISIYHAAEVSLFADVAGESSA